MRLAKLFFLYKTMDNKKKFSKPPDRVLASSDARPKTLQEVTIFNVQQPLAASTAERQDELVNSRL